MRGFPMNSGASRLIRYSGNMETVGRDKCPIRELGLLHLGEVLTNGDWRSSVRERGRCWFGMKLECCHRQKAENRMPPCLLGLLLSPARVTVPDHVSLDAPLPKTPHVSIAMLPGGFLTISRCPHCFSVGKPCTLVKGLLHVTRTLNTMTGTPAKSGKRSCG